MLELANSKRRSNNELAELNLSVSHFEVGCCDYKTVHTMKIVGVRFSVSITNYSALYHLGQINALIGFNKYLSDEILVNPLKCEQLLFIPSFQCCVLTSLIMPTG